MIRSAASLAAIFFLISICKVTFGEVIFESATLGQSGISRFDASSGDFPGLNISIATFAGVRFELTEPAVTQSIGGHFVGPFSEEDTIFGALVRLDGPEDFPDSTDLSTPDVLGATLINLPLNSGDVFGDLSLELEPAWYGLVFGGGLNGQGLFGARGVGGALATNQDIGSPSYFGYGSGSDWGPRSLGGLRFVLEGQIVPEPLTLPLIVVGCVLPFFLRTRPTDCFDDAPRTTQRFLDT